MSKPEHWEAVYTAKAVDQVSWYAPHLERSLAYLEAAALPKSAAILDVGGGASTLPDDLLDRGYTGVAVLDIAPAAIERARQRLGERADRVRWIVGDVTNLDLPPASIDFWHDRAVFHFLRTEEERARYVALVKKAVRVGGHVLVATFGPEGPERCSGLDVVRYDAAGIHAEFGTRFQKVDSSAEQHTTPWGSVQEFVYCFCVMK